MSDDMDSRRIGTPNRRAWQLHPCGKYVEVQIADGIPSGDAFMGLCARKGWTANPPPADRLATKEDVLAYNAAQRPAKTPDPSPVALEPVPVEIPPVKPDPIPQRQRRPARKANSR